MAGHSKWANIQHRKNAQDAKRSRLFTKLIREVSVAARQSPDADTNPRLRLAISKALRANISRDTLNKAIKKVSDPHEKNLEEIRYEGYGPGGIAILVEAFTDNRNRTAAEVRHMFSKHGGQLGAEGSVAWTFHRKGLIQLSGSDFEETDLMELALESGAEDFVFSPSYEFSAKLITDTESLENVTATLEEKNIPIEEASLTWLPTNRILVEDEMLLNKINSLVDGLEELTDVQTVYASCSWQLS
jgi:YebC/PmpR family DNA-binding regulatory protein